MTLRFGTRVFLASALIFALATPALAVCGKATHGATCTVSQAVVVGSGIVVTVSGITRHMTPYGWFAVRDTGPSEGQAVTTFDVPPAYGDNGSYLIDWNVDQGVADFMFTVQADPGEHTVTAEYRKAFATCTYTVPNPA